MPEIKSYAPGIYARSETLVQATRDLDRGRTTEAAVQDQREVDLRSFLDAQREAGLDYLSDGLLNWQDIFRPFDEAAEAGTWAAHALPEHQHLLPGSSRYRGGPDAGRATRGAILPHRGPPEK